MTKAGTRTQDVDLNTNTMKRSTNFLIAFATAAITFGTLHLAIGPKHFGWRNHYRHAYGAYGDHRSCTNNNQESKDKDTKTTAPDQDSSK